MDNKAVEWKEVICPACKEKMDAPKNREVIHCLFCGAQILMDTNSRGDIFRKEFFSLRTKEVFDRFLSYSEQFSYENYPHTFTAFCQEYALFLHQVDCGIRKKEMDFMEETIVEMVQTYIEEKSTKRERAQLQYQLNSFMATYLFPAILRSSREEGRAFCIKLSKKWGQTFPESNIKVTDYETIFSGFRRKLCYITTAVCLALHKREDCLEIRQMKAYRDEYLFFSPGGESLIKEYYNIAPTIVKRISRQPDSKDRYLQIWSEYIKPCLELLDQEKPDECKIKYRKMVTRLRKEYIESWDK